MLLDGVYDDLAVLHVFLGQNRQHVDQWLAVVRQIDETGQILARELLVLFVGGRGGGGRCAGISGIHTGC